jgi:superfamily I DNA/RNA helicase
VTYNRALLAFLRQIITGDDDLLEVRNYHHFALGYLKSQGVNTDQVVVQGRQRENLIADALQATRTTRKESVLSRNTSFFDAELSWMGRHGIESEDDYVQADRVGRIHSLSPLQRPAVYAVRTAYEELRAAAGKNYDWDDLATDVVDRLGADGDERRYKHIVVDEGQDFTLEMLRSLVGAVDPDGSFTLFGDAAQQIYGRGISWRSAGIEVSKVWEFAHNYRNSRPIVRLAQAIADMPYFNDAEDLVEPDDDVDEGPPPTMKVFNDAATENRWVVEQAQALGRTGTTAVLFHRNADADRFLLQCRGARRLDRDTPTWSAQPGIWAATVHAAKGYEFQSVILTGLAKDRWPEPQAVNAEGEDEAAASDGRLLYVAVTRARQNLLMTATGATSDLLPDGEGLWVESTG